MTRVRVIPVLLKKGKGLVKTVRFKNPIYLGDPINAIKIFNEKEVDELIILDITATPDKREPDYKFIQDISSECFMPLGYGGGISSIEQIKKIFALGVEKVILNTAANKFPKLVEESARVFGNQSIVVAIDVKKNFWGKNKVVIKCGKEFTSEDPVEYAKKMETLGAGEIFINSVDRDGTYKGYDIELLYSISSAVTVPVIACGGASSVDDMVCAVQKGKVSAIAAGSIFVFHGKKKGVLINFPLQEEFKNKL